MKDVVVIGASPIGLTAAVRATNAGLSVTLAIKDVGGIQLGTGMVDALDYRPKSAEAPLEALKGHVVSRPTHPYSHVISDSVDISVAWLRDLAGADAFTGSEVRNVCIPTNIGALRSIRLIPSSMETGIP